MHTCVENLASIIKKIGKNIPQHTTQLSCHNYW